MIREKLDKSLAAPLGDSPGVSHITVSAPEAWALLLSTIRYSMGRATYMPQFCRDMYSRLKSALTLNQRRQIADEIDKELTMTTQLGHAVDHQTWVEFRDMIDAETERSRPNKCT